MSEAVLLAGYARQNITPDYPCPMSGYGNEAARLSQKILDPVYLTCIALTSGDETLLLYSADLIGFDEWTLAELRAAIFDATGIAAEKAFFSATHTHSGPAPNPDHENGNHETVYRYRNDLCDAAAAAAVAALADRAPAQLLTATQRVPGMNFIRHYVRQDGTYAGSGFGQSDAERIGHASMTDPRMVLVQLKRENKPAIVLMNWQAHNDNVSGVGFYNISSSYTGKIREKFEAETGMCFAYISGASGNQNPNSLIREEHHGLDWIQYGHAMADHAIAAIAKLKAVKGTQIKTVHVQLAVNANHAWDHLLPQAREVCDLWKRTDDREQASTLARSYGFTSCFHAATCCDRAALPPTVTIEMNAFRIGDLGFITSPNEMFSDIGNYVRAYAPFDTVFICAGNRFYVPQATAYDYRSYEADTSRYAKGTCEKVSREYVRMLQELKTL